MEAVQLVEDFSFNRACEAVKFHLNKHSIWTYYELTGHLWMSFESGESFSSLVGNFHSRPQINLLMIY